MFRGYGSGLSEEIILPSTEIINSFDEAVFPKGLTMTVKFIDAFIEMLENAYKLNKEYNNG